MFRSRFGRTVVVAVLGIFAGIGLLITLVPEAVKMPNFHLGQRTLWFNESLETDREILHDKRRYIMRETCKRLNSSYANKNTFNYEPSKFYNIYVNDEFKFLYCSVPKVACSNWKRALLSLLGIKSTDQIPNSDIYDHGGKYYQTLTKMKLSEYSEEAAMYRIKHYKKFIFVREPFERLLSAWRNKFTVSSNLYFQSRWGAYIIRLYRENPTRESLNKGNDVTFPEFVRFVLSLQTVTDNMHNDHWQPYETLCYPCIVDYDYIGKYETMDDDIRYVTKKLDIKGLEFPERSVRYKHAPTRNFLDEEYAKIPLSEIHEIYNNYKTDFAVFNYPYKSFDKYDPYPPSPLVTV